jgi:hypothetical protein
MGEAAVQLIPHQEVQPSVASVSYIPLPRHAHRVSIGMFLLRGAAVIAALFVFAAFEPTLRGHLGFILTIWAIALPIGVVVTNIAGGERATHIDAKYTNELSERVIGLDGQLSTIFLRRQWWTWDAFLAACRGAAIEPPRTIVDERVKGRLEPIELPLELLEPEPILSSGTSGRKAAVFMIFLYCLFTLLQLSVGNYFFAALFAALGLFLAATYPPVRDFFRTFRVDEGNLILGTGSLSHRGDKRWTVNDAVMLVQTTNGKPPYYVSFVGRAGYKLLTFTDERDPDFVKLWQRWNHPKPRPELVVE